MSKVFLKKLGKNIKNIRKRKDLSQEKLAELVGITRNAIGMIERGETNAPILTLYRIFKALDIDLTKTFTEID